MKKYLIAFVFCVLMGVGASRAESEVYLFVKNGVSSTFHVSVDGKVVCDLDGPTKKTLDGAGMFKQLYKIAHPCYRKLIFNKEGKVVISIEQDYTNCINLQHTVFKGETQLNLEDGETYYLEVAGKGLRNIQLKELEAKKAMKNLSSDKWKELSTVTVNP